MRAQRRSHSLPFQSLLIKFTGGKAAIARTSCCKGQDVHGRARVQGCFVATFPEVHAFLKNVTLSPHIQLIMSFEKNHHLIMLINNTVTEELEVTLVAGDEQGPSRSRGRALKQKLIQMIHRTTTHIGKVPQTFSAISSHFFFLMKIAFLFFFFYTEKLWFSSKPFQNSLTECVKSTTICQTQHKEAKLRFKSFCGLSKSFGHNGTGL